MLAARQSAAIRMETRTVTTEPAAVSPAMASVHAQHEAAADKLAAKVATQEAQQAAEDTDNAPPLRATNYSIELRPAAGGVFPVNVGGNLPAATFALTQMLESLRIGDNRGTLRLVADVRVGTAGAPGGYVLQVVLHEQAIERDS